MRIAERFEFDAPSDAVATGAGDAMWEVFPRELWCGDRRVGSWRDGAAAPQPAAGAEVTSRPVGEPARTWTVAEADGEIAGRADAALRQWLQIRFGFGSPADAVWQALEASDA